MAESRILKVEDRAEELARNYWTRILSYKDNNKDLCNIMNKLDIIEAKYRFRNQRRVSNLFLESWRGVWKIRQKIENKPKYGIYGSNYWTLTNNVKIDLDIGKERKKKYISDEELLKKYSSKYRLRKGFEIIYTDGSFKNDSRSMGVGIVREDSEIGYNMSINAKCSSYTAELIVIEKALDMAEELEWENDILI